MQSIKSNFRFRPIKWIYFINEAHPIFPNIFFNCFYSITIFTFFFSLFGASSFSWVDLAIATSTYSLLQISLKAIHDLSNQESDTLHFPNKSLVTGVVSRQDLHTFSYLLLSIALIIHLCIFHLNLVTQIYSAIFLTAVFMYKIFSLSNKIKNNISLRFIIQALLTLLANLYILSFLITNEHRLFELKNIASILLFTLVSLSWHLSLKTKSKREESTYPTYSQIWGAKLSIYTILTFLYTSTSCYWYLIHSQIKNDPGQEYGKIIYIIAALPVLSLLNTHFQGLNLIEGKRRGDQVLKAVKMHATALTLSAFIFSLLYLFN